MYAIFFLFILTKNTSIRYGYIDFNSKILNEIIGCRINAAITAILKQTIFRHSKKKLCERQENVTDKHKNVKRLNTRNKGLKRYEKAGFKSL